MYSGTLKIRCLCRTLLVAVGRYTTKYIKSKAKVVADAFSRKNKEVHMTSSNAMRQLMYLRRTKGTEKIIVDKFLRRTHFISVNSTNDSKDSKDIPEIFYR